MLQLTQKQIESEFSQRGWKLLDKYIRNVEPLKCVCPKGHETTISWCNLKNGQGCRFCAGNIKFTYEEANAYFEEQGCKLLESNYINSQELLKFKCTCGSISEISFAKFRTGHRCKFCRDDRIAKGLRTPIEEVHAFYKKHGCTLLTEEYKDNRTKMPYICKCGSMASATYSNFQKCPNCWKCGNEKKSGDKCYLWNPDRETVARNKKYRKICGNILMRALGVSATKKEDHTYVLLGYSGMDLQKHIHYHPNYKGEDGMQIDHIFPIKAFMDYEVYDLKIINALDNLQPLYGIENQEKFNKYDNVQFEKWLKFHGISFTQ